MPNSNSKPISVELTVTNTTLKITLTPAQSNSIQQRYLTESLYKQAKFLRRWRSQRNFAAGNTCIQSSFNFCIKIFLHFCIAILV